MKNREEAALFVPRGIRNHNPGNIISGPVRWQGLAAEQSDPRFVVFESPVFGLRALMKILRTYYCKYNLDTVRAIINRWAPPQENATDHYIEHVCRVLKTHRDLPVNLLAPGTMIALAQAIVRHENGKPPAGRTPFWYEEGLYCQAHDLAFKREEKKK